MVPRRFDAGGTKLHEKQGGDDSTLRKSALFLQQPKDCDGNIRLGNYRDNTAKLSAPQVMAW